LHRSIKLILSFSFALLAFTLPLAGQSQNPTPLEQANLKLVLDWWREVITFRHVELAPNYAHEDLIQHNPNFPNGLAALRKAFGARPPANPIPATLPPQNAPVVSFAKGDYVVLIFEREETAPADPSKKYKYNTFDLFRIEDGKIKEHWDGAMKSMPEEGKKE
jgi:predicted SnoaL-like aldol condensation-catalyzing enzyme